MKAVIITTLVMVLVLWLASPVKKSIVRVENTTIIEPTPLPRPNLPPKIYFKKLPEKSEGFKEYRISGTKKNVGGGVEGHAVLVDGARSNTATSREVRSLPGANPLEGIEAGTQALPTDAISRNNYLEPTPFQRSVEKALTSVEKMADEELDNFSATQQIVHDKKVVLPKKPTELGWNWCAANTVQKEGAIGSILSVTDVKNSTVVLASGSKFNLTGSNQQVAEEPLRIVVDFYVPITHPKEDPNRMVGFITRFSDMAHNILTQKFLESDPKNNCGNFVVSAQAIMPEGMPFDSANGWLYLTAVTAKGVQASDAPELLLGAPKQASLK